MEDSEFTMIGCSREVLEMIADPGTFAENEVGGGIFSAEFGPGAIVGTGKIDSRHVTIIANDADAINERYSSVFAGIIGLEEAYKMADAVYVTIEADKEKDISEKRAIVLIVDTPGNAPGKIEEVIGMNKATGAYQAALAEARAAGHPVVAMVIGRAISGGFLCHGLQADHVLALSEEFGTIVHVMPLTSISRITKMDIEQLEELSVSNPVFASGVDFFYKLGGIDEIIYSLEDINGAVKRHIAEVRRIKAEKGSAETGPKRRGVLGAERGGRIYRKAAMKKMKEEYDAVINRYLTI